MEQDFRLEAFNAAQCAENIKISNDPRVYIPHTFPNLSGKRVLTMEFVKGIPISDVAAIKDSGINPKEVAQVVINLFADQIMCHGFVHCDPHPGNLLVRPLPKKQDKGVLRRLWRWLSRRTVTPCQVVPFLSLFLFFSLSMGMCVYVCVWACLMIFDLLITFNDPFITTCIDRLTTRIIALL